MVSRRKFLMCKGFYHFRPKFVIRLFFVLVLLTISWNEFLSFEFSTIAWIARLRQFEGNAVKILLVADPQLIGYKNELGPFKWIRRWDADRYLKNGFSRALRVSDPDAIIFMGDLFDEGVQMSVNQYTLTCQRFDNIFCFSESIQRIYIPGDNDVGGEGGPVIPELVSRFKKHFISRFDPSKIGLSDFDVVHVNAFSNTSDIIAKGTGELKLILSHAPLLRVHGTIQKMLRNLNPSLVLSAHDHVAEIYRDGRVSYNFYRASLYKYSKAVETEISKDSPLIELQTPTCSYRMGVPDMGYGLLMLRKTRNDSSTYFIKYHVLWLPSRFMHLSFYAFELFFCTVIFLRLLVRSKFFKLFS